jgi:hypothetical protein
LGYLTSWAFLGFILSRRTFFTLNSLRTVIRYLFRLLAYRKRRIERNKVSVGCIPFPEIVCYVDTRDLRVNFGVFRNVETYSIRGDVDLAQLGCLYKINVGTVHYSLVGDIRIQ